MSLISKRKRKIVKNSHPTKRILIKEADVDDEMIPLIKWLNSYQSITTAFCCQGEPKTEDKETDELNRPYVLFTCIDTIDLISVLSAFGYRAITEIHWSEEKRQIEYCTRFYDQKSLFDTIDYITNKQRLLKKRIVH